MYEVCRKACNLCGERRSPGDPAVLFLKLVTMVENLIDQGKLSSSGTGNANGQPQIIYQPIAYPIASNTSCADKAGPDGRSNCAETKYLCQDTRYKALMAEQCPATCGLCVNNTNTQNSQSVSNTGACEDKTKDGRSDCPGKGYLCRSPTYITIMREECPKTCGYCGSAAAYPYYYYSPYGYYYYGKK
uniref:ShTK domain protein n=2 Tax=Bursaphelenchus xylophilus TaxID=6326 RepID=A0A1I7SBL6_BURXY